jgi:hypothetical protein
LSGLVKLVHHFIRCLILKSKLGIEGLFLVKVVLTISNLFLSASPRGEVSRPVVFRIIGIREHIIILSRPADLFLSVEGIKILARGGVHQSDVGS